MQEKRSANYVLELLDKHEILVIKDGMNNLQKKQINDARDQIEQSILWTDIKRHEEQMDALRHEHEARERQLIELHEGEQRRNAALEGEVPWTRSLAHQRRL